MTLKELAKQWADAAKAANDEKERKLCEDVVEYLSNYYCDTYDEGCRDDQN